MPKYIRAWGLVRTLQEWAADPLCQCTESRILERLAEHWPAEKAISTPSAAGVLAGPPAGNEKKSIYRGVTFNGEKRLWQAQIRNGDRVDNLGYYSTQIEAAKVWDKRAWGMRGNDARLNFPEDYEHG